MTDAELETLVAQSPIHRDEPTWLAVQDHLLRRFREVVPADVQLGPYWISNHYDNDGSFGSRIRCRTGLPFVPESDAWEASSCTSGDKLTSWTDIYAFPFRRGRIVKPGGAYWNLRYESGAWHSRGWKWSDYGEWEGIRRAGDCYVFTRHVCEMVRQPSHARPPIAVIRSGKRFGEQWPEEGVRALHVSLHDVRRAGEPDDLSAETILALLDPARQATVPVYLSPRITSGEFAIGNLAVRGGWIPGDYTVSLRVRSEPHRTDGPASDVTAPISFTIR